MTNEEIAELRNLVMCYPVSPGDTMSHSAMRYLFLMCFAVRNADGDWIPTASGIDQFWIVT